MIYEMAVKLNNSVHFTRLYFYTKKEALKLARKHDSVTLYDGSGKVLFQRLNETD